MEYDNRTPFSKWMLDHDFEFTTVMLVMISTSLWLLHAPQPYPILTTAMAAVMVYVVLMALDIHKLVLFISIGIVITQFWNETLGSAISLIGFYKLIRRILA